MDTTIPFTEEIMDQISISIKESDLNKYDSFDLLCNISKLNNQCIKDNSVFIYDGKYYKIKIMNGCDTFYSYSDILIIPHHSPSFIKFKTQ